MIIPLTAWLEPPRPIALITDFGLADGYVGALKGLIATVNPAIPTIDVTHNLPPQDLWAARFVVANVVGYFPLGTVFLAVVDPGVGSDRRSVAVAFDRGWLVGPDNGLWSGVLSQFSVRSAVELTRSDFWRVPNPSATFHGRDIFAPVAAYLANGVNLEELGDPIDPASLVQLSLPPLVERSLDGDAIPAIEGVVQHIDHFGNAITTIPADRVLGRPWNVRIGDRPIEAAHTYSHVPWGDLVAIVGSHNWVEVACRGGSAADVLQLQRGDRVAVEWLPTA